MNVQLYLNIFMIMPFGNYNLIELEAYKQKEKNIIFRKIKEPFL